MTPIETITAFIAAWDRYDLEGIYAFMADDIEWEDVPLSTVKGIEKVRAKMANFPGVEACGFETHHIAANGNVVLTERTDWFEMKGRKRTIRVMGTFELNDDGKITKWRDYFDIAEFQREFGDLAEG
ncbi:MAG: limonene-1,2-epoxide hydrolase family protein [Pseudomonadota bacterium]